MNVPALRPPSVDFIVGQFTFVAPSLVNVRLDIDTECGRDIFD